MPTSDPQFERRLAAIFQGEAAEHVRRMLASLAELETGRAGAPAGKPLELLFRAAHSLKGAARAVGEDEVETVCHATESLLAGLQRGRLGWSPAIADALHAVVAELQRSLASRGANPGALAALVPRLERLALGGGSETEDAPAAAPAAAAAALPPAPAAMPAHADEAVRIPVQRLDGLLYLAEALVAARLQGGDLLAELDEVLATLAALRGDAVAPGPRMLQQLEARLRRLRSRAGSDQRRLAGDVDALLSEVKKTLLLPVASLRPVLVAAVRELARSEGKEVDLRIRGDEVELDRSLLQQLREPLLHLLRNAIGHGLEPPQQRVAAGKPSRGVVEVAIASRGGGRVEITAADDGAGIDTARLAQAAREQGLPVAEGAEAAELLPLVFGQGVSTARQLTSLAGRGIGLAIVRDAVERMGGTVSVASVPGHGTIFTIVLATSLATWRAIKVVAGGRSFLLPTARVERALRLPPEALRTVGAQQTVAVGDEELPLVSLAGVLRLPAPATAAARIPCLLLAAGGRRVALAVDEIRGEQEVLAKPVDGAARGAIVAGAAVVASGRLAPILNVSELVRTALREGGGAARAPVTARPRGRKVLVAEDSITSRTLLKNILELAGHEVDVAVDGEDALARLRGGRYDVVVSDVEMPRLDGIALTQAIRRDPALAHLPVVLVTSLASPADRERGAEAGANAYIVKSAFDQGNLVQVVSELE